MYILKIFRFDRETQDPSLSFSLSVYLIVLFVSFSLFLSFSISFLFVFLRGHYDCLLASWLPKLRDGLLAKQSKQAGMQQQTFARNVLAPCFAAGSGHYFHVPPAAMDRCSIFPVCFTAMYQ